ncbi:hypothetical protein DV735_g3370, partial [Chaetothyriales sp. CBS 134920]
MASSSITLQIQPRGKPVKKLPASVSLPPSASGAQLYSSVAAPTGFSVHRLRLTKGSDGTVIPNSADSSLDAAGLREQSTVVVKDLGPQIGWRTVFVIEYLGPILFHPLVYGVLRPYLYTDAPAQASQLQTLSLLVVVAHFVKREIETLFIHRFSSSTMPLRNLFKNSGHYWLLSGLNLAYWLYRPTSSAAVEPPNPALLYPGLVLYGLGEIANFNVHVALRNLRRSGTAERGIPHGPLFDLVTCPNYLTEVISWVGVYLISGLNWSVLLFLAVSIAQMAQWAVKKERRYRKEFGDKYKPKRYTMLPGIW